MSDRYWYQDGMHVLMVTFVAGILLWMLFERANRVEPAVVEPTIVGQLHKPLFGSPSLEIKVWHQYPAALRNVVLFVQLTEDPAKTPDSWQKREHSFESWAPNKDQSVSFTFPLQKYEPNEEIHIAIVLGGKTIKPYIESFTWQGTNWKTKE